MLVYWMRSCWSTIEQPNRLGDSLHATSAQRKARTLCRNASASASAGSGGRTRNVPDGRKTPSATNACASNCSCIACIPAIHGGHVRIEVDERQAPRWSGSDHKRRQNLSREHGRSWFRLPVEKKKPIYQYSELVTVSLPTGKKAHYSRRQVTRQGKGRLLATYDVKNRSPVAHNIDSITEKFYRVESSGKFLNSPSIIIVVVSGLVSPVSVSMIE